MSVFAPTVFIALVVVQDEQGRFLLVDEKRDRGWYLPAGRVDPGEMLVEGAIREVREETGIDVRLTGVLRFEHTPMPTGSARVRVVFTGSPVGGKLKETPDQESNGAAWFTREECAALRLRSAEVLTHFDRACVAAPFPLSLLSIEGMPYAS